MSRIAFLITNRHQIFHYMPIFEALGESCTFVIETRDRDFGVDEAYVHQHAPGAQTDRIAKERLHDLDGRYELVVCQTPPLVHALLNETLVVAQQYSLGKERYQYGAWRSLANLNLMYGAYSVTRVQGFSYAAATGHAMFDAYFADAPPSAPTATRAGGLYLPTYGSLSSLPAVAPLLGEFECEITVKLHHMDALGVADQLPANCKVVHADASLVDLLGAADFVISDYSGAAYDAIYARRPLVLGGAHAPTDRDLDRLSAADTERRELRALAAVWRPDDSLSATIETAREQIANDEAYREFVERFYVNQGTAAMAAADAILQLLEGGQPTDFGREQVRDNYQEQLIKVRNLRASNMDLKADVANLRIENRDLLHPTHVLRRWYHGVVRRIRRALTSHNP